MLKIFLIFLISLSSFANDVTFVKKGEIIKNDGYLFTEQKAKEVRLELLDKEKLIIENNRKDSILTIRNEQLRMREDELELYKKQNERLVKSNNINSNLKTMYFILGIVVTSAAVYGASSLSK